MKRREFELPDVWEGESQKEFCGSKMSSTRFEMQLYSTLRDIGEEIVV